MGDPRYRLPLFHCQGCCVARHVKRLLYHLAVRCTGYEKNVTVMFASAACVLRLRMDGNALLRVFKGARLRLQDLPCLVRRKTALSFLRTKDIVDF